MGDDEVVYIPTDHARLYLAEFVVPIFTILPSLSILDSTTSTVLGDTSTSISHISLLEMGTRDSNTTDSTLSVLLFFLGTADILRLSRSVTQMFRASLKLDFDSYAKIR